MGKIWFNLREAGTVWDGTIVEAALAAGDSVVTGARRDGRTGILWWRSMGERVKPVTLEVRR